MPLIGHYSLYSPLIGQGGSHPGAELCPAQLHPHQVSPDDRQIPDTHRCRTLITSFSPSHNNKILQFCQAPYKSRFIGILSSLSPHPTKLYYLFLGRQHGVIRPENPKGLSTNFTLMPEYLKQLGYDTEMVGKWHLGFCKEAYLPTR